MPRRRAHADNEPMSRPTHHEHCLYLLAEVERMIDRAAADWSRAEVSVVKSRLTQIAEMLRRLYRRITHLHRTRPISGANPACRAILRGTAGRREISPSRSSVSSIW
jgi:hypothetical protein